MRVEPDAARNIIIRLRRAEGQVRGIITMMEADRDCGEIVTQLAAVSRALDRASFQLLASQLQQCLAASSSEEDKTLDLERLEKLFLSLA